MIEVDAERRAVSITPQRLLGFAMVPCFAATPAGLFAIQLHGTHTLTTGGWAIAVGYSVLTVFMAVMLLSPKNRRMRIDFSTDRLSVAPAYGIGTAIDASLREIGIRCEESERVHDGRSIITSKAVARVGSADVPLLALTNDAVDVPRRLVAAIVAAQRGDVPALADFQAHVATVGRHGMKKYVGVLALLLAPGALYVWGYASG
jgi:hypothetical protein